MVGSPLVLVVSWALALALVASGGALLDAAEEEKARARAANDACKRSGQGGMTGIGCLGAGGPMAGFDEEVLAGTAFVLAAVAFAAPAVHVWWKDRRGSPGAAPR